MDHSLFQRNIPLAEYSHYKIGGPAKYFLDAENNEALQRALAAARDMGERIAIIGAGTNILFDDSGFDGVVIHLTMRDIAIEGDRIRAGAGALMDELVSYTAAHGLTGLEWAGGLPGTFGGAIYGNAGAFGGEMKDIIEEVVSISRTAPHSGYITRRGDTCGFEYRSSAFKRGANEEIIVEAVVRLAPGDPSALRQVIEERIAYRRLRQPGEHPNIGSIFKNVALAHIPRERRGAFAHVVKTDPFPVIPAAYLISEAGLKGISCGGAMISPKHPNFIVNVLRARADDVRELIALVKDEVRRAFGVELEEEIIQW